MKENIKNYIAVFVALAISAVFYELNPPSTFVTNSAQSEKSFTNINSSIVGKSNSNVTVSAIEGSGRTIKINSVILEKPGFVVIRKIVSRGEMPIVGVSRYILNGVGNNIIIVLSKDPEPRELFMANFYLDDGNRIFSPEDDIPLLNEENQFQSTSIQFQ